MWYVKFAMMALLGTLCGMVLLPIYIVFGKVSKWPDKVCEVYQCLSDKLGLDIIIL